MTRQDTFQLAPRTSLWLYTDEKRDCMSSHTSLLQSKEQSLLQIDASIKGLGACLLQEEKPVYFASKALTDVQ